MTEITMELLLALSKEAPRHCNVDGLSCAPMPSPSPSPRTNNYQSVFRIDGQPILPPLMTKEKRFEMMKLKKLAMEREAQRRRSSQRCSSEQDLDAGDTATLVNEVIEPNVHEPIVANQFYDALHAQQFVNASKLSCEAKKYINASTCTETSIVVESKRIQHLQRSETIIYDNRCNSIIMPMNSGHELRQGGQALMVAEESENLYNALECSSLSETDISNATNTQPQSSPSDVVSEIAVPFSPKRPQSLTFETLAPLSQQQIPAICVNPPTPQVDPSVQSASQMHNFVDTLPRQLDDQCECLHTRKQTSNSISSKVISFKHNDCVTTTTTTATKPKSPCADDKLKRSVTSPSLKTIGKPDAAPAISNSNSLNVSNVSADQTQHVMRSNSFTLERPSKVLLEHMERHQTQSPGNKPGFWSKADDATTNQLQPQLKEKAVAYARSMTSGNLSHQAHFRRETVESKAKRVNKIEVKQRMTPVRNTAKFKQKTTLASSRSSSATSNIYRTAVSAASSPNGSSSLITTRHAAQQVLHSYKNSHTPLANSNTSPRNTNNNNMPAQQTSATSLALNKNKQSASEPRAITSQPQSQQQLSTKRASKKVTNPIKAVPATKPSRSVANRAQHSSVRHAKQNQNMALLQQEPTDNNKSLHEQPPVKPQAQMQTQAQSHQQHLEHSQQLQLKLQQLQQQRQLARNALSPTLMSQQMLSEIESAQRQKFMQLIAQQHEEQRRLQAQFDAQQKLLLEQICSEMTSTQLSCNDSRLAGGQFATYNEAKYEQRAESNSSTSDSPGDSVSSVMDAKKCRGSIKSLPSSPDGQITSNEAMVQSSSSSSAASTPRSQIEVSASRRDSSGISTQTSQNMALHLNNSARKRLNFDNKGCAGTPTQQLDLVLISNDRPTQASHHALPRSSTVSLPETRRQQPAMPRTRFKIVNEHEHVAQTQAQHRREVAATKINAWARGFLVRRLFRTEQIQRIVQTIRDTLIFVLNLHLETSNRASAVDAVANEDTSANVRLKARLLQQLCSASRTLHLVFFQTTLRERMEIIARDRKRLKAKLIAINMKRANITQ